MYGAISYTLTGFVLEREMEPHPSEDPGWLAKHERAADIEDVKGHFNTV